MDNNQSSHNVAKLFENAHNVSVSQSNLINTTGNVTVALTNNISGNNERYKTWLDPPDPSINHNGALAKHHPNTGNWLLSHSEYEYWKKMSNSFLWLHGLSGSGKTILCSMVVDNVCALVGQGSIGLAYYYFDVGDVRKINVEGLLSSLVLSLYTCNPCNHTTLDQLYKVCKDGVFKPSGQQLEGILKELLSGFKETYIVIDALDECKDWQGLCKFLKRIHGWEIGQCHLLITSRKEQVIVKSLQHVEHEEIDLTLMPVGDDINKYIDEVLEESEELAELELETKQHIKKLLKEKANGMFRWVACQIVELEHCSSSMVALKNTLEMLPKDLETTYDQILSRIHAADAMHAMKLLHWLVFAFEPLMMEELAIVVQIDIEKNALDPTKGLGSPKDILKICSSLVTVNEGGRVQLAHASVKEYFLKEPRKIGTSTIDPSTGNLAMTRYCIAYMHHPRPENRYLQTWTLPGYCGKLWHKHVLACKDGTAVEEQILMVCDSEGIAFKNWRSWRKDLHIWEPETPLEHAILSGLQEAVKWLLHKSKISKTILLFAVIAGDIEIIKLLLDKGADVNAQCGYYGNALQAASHQGNKDIIELLLDRGADVNAQGGEWGNALQLACMKGGKEIVKVLLDKGADVNAQGGEYGNALQVASCQGNKDIVEVLLDKDADMNAQGGRYGSALQAASHWGEKEIVEVLLGKGADVNAQGGEYGNALQAASHEGNKDIIEVLLDKGADVNAHGGLYTNAIHAASSQGNKDIVELLFDKGADVNVQGGKHGNALQAASLKGHKDTVELLLDKGADVNAQGGQYGSALQAASSQGNKNIVELLLGKGAEVNAQGGFYGNALQAASLKGGKEIVKVLLDKGADVNAQGGECGNALQAASSAGNKNTVELLLDKGADVNAQGGGYGNALQAASSHGKKDIVKLLLGKGAGVNDQGGFSDNVLQVAASHGLKEIVEVLLEKGADVNAQNGQYGNALHAASLKNHKDIVELLFYKGADVNAQGGFYGNALQAASYQSNKGIVEVLLSKGAEVNAQGGRYGNALQAASLMGYKDIVELLLDKGADVNAQGGQFGNALQAASHWGDKEIVEMLLDKGADVNAQGGQFGNALSAAIRGGQKAKAIVQLLIAYGANE